ncbi:MAG UNVERIFIED_CONTAM: hypothetical protein LVR18_28080 [Planctomycetaceae bacterium]
MASKRLHSPVIFALLHALERVFVFFLRFENRDRQWRRTVWNLDAEEVVSFAWACAATAFRPGGFHRGRRFQPNVWHAITLFPKDWVDQLIPSFGFILEHSITPHRQLTDTQLPGLSFD